MQTRLELLVNLTASMIIGIGAFAALVLFLYAIAEFLARRHDTNHGGGNWK